MSVRDTGWHRPTNPVISDIRADVRARQVGGAVMWADRGGNWVLRVRGTTVATGRADDALARNDVTPDGVRDAAKRAAEDALRQLCRDTLAALGDGE